MNESNDSQSEPTGDLRLIKENNADARGRATELRTVDEWCGIVFPPSPSGRDNRHLWRHSAAAALHGWPQHAHHTGAPMRLSRTDYDAAINAALQPDLTSADYVPHAAALSPHK